MRHTDDNVTQNGIGFDHLCIDYPDHYCLWKEDEVGTRRNAHQAGPVGRCPNQR